MPQCLDNVLVNLFLDRAIFLLPSSKTKCLGSIFDSKISDQQKSALAATCNDSFPVLKYWGSVLLQLVILVQLFNHEKCCTGACSITV